MQINYRTFSDFLSTVSPFKLQKISINAGFSCPNRDGSKGVGGCTYCNNRTFSPAYTASNKSVTKQLEDGVRFFANKYPDMKYLAYFQAYTNTYDTIDRLLARYYEALDFPGVEGLIISTRPDCMPEELLSELEKIAKNRLLLVEYGIESTDNQTLNYINRCHTFEDAVDCIERTYRRGIFCGVHIILGLPGETREMIVSHAVKISGLPLTTVKIHQLQVIRGTAMERQYHTNPELFHFFTVEEYIALCIDFLCHLNPNFYIDRFVSQSPAESLIVPGWGLKNHEFTVKLNAAIASV